MAIYIVEGKIGAGKTYYCVYHVLKRYYYFDQIFGEYLPKKDVFFLSNIDNLKLDHVSLNKEIEDKGIENVFCEKYIQDIRATYKCSNIIFIIDEAQNLFHRKFYNKDVFYFFQYSRHYGVDFYLVCQDVDSLVKEIKTLAEGYIHAISRSHGSGLSFTYKFIINDEVVRRVVVKRDANIFKLYRSFIADEAEKPRPVYLRYIVIMGSLFILALLMFKFVFVGFFSHSMALGNKAAIAKKVDKLQIKRVSGSVRAVGSEFRDYKELNMVKVPSPPSPSVSVVGNRSNDLDQSNGSSGCTTFMEIQSDEGLLTGERCNGRIIRKLNGNVILAKDEKNRNTTTGLQGRRLSPTNAVDLSSSGGLILNGNKSY